LILNVYAIALKASVQLSHPILRCEFINTKFRFGLWDLQIDEYDIIVHTLFHLRTFFVKQKTQAEPLLKSLMSR
jgi:hypothetical protein